MKHVGLGFVLLALVGCGSGKGDVSGTVTYKKNPLKFGSVTIVAANGLAFQGEIAENGRYEIKNIPLGKAKFFVVCQSSKGTVNLAKSGRPGSDSAAPPEVPVNLIPDKYSDFSQENLAHEITSGENTIDLKLEP